MRENSPTDWETIERVYRAGVISLREIARAHSISDTAIRKRAKAEGWERDLTEKVKERARSKLVRDDGSQSGSHPQRERTDREIVEEASETQVYVVKAHRRDIASGRNILGKLFDELNDAIDHREEIEDDIVAETATDKDGQRRTRMLRAVALGSRAGVMLSLSAAMKNVIVLERQAFNISTEGDKDGPATTIEVVNYGDQGPTAA